MKLKAVLISAIAGLALVGCNDSDITGTYAHDGDTNLTVYKSNDGKAILLETSIKVKNIAGGESKVPYFASTYNKDGKLYALQGDELIAEINGNEVKLLKNNTVYKKKN